MTRLVLSAFLSVGCTITASAQTTTDPFPARIPATEGAIRVSFVEFASLPDVGGQPARPMLLVDEPGTRR
ncbi:MAG: hypothetical protein HY654_05005, partial [Acidobacteria bacterium]|nr:hypothetical protein [Acidobacteriota bacterium]